MKVGIIGAGLIGNKRAAVLSDSQRDRVIMVADVDISRAEKLASLCRNCQVAKNWQGVVNHPQVDAVIVATTHDWLAPITLAALKAGKHVLCEKPLGINVAEVVKCVRLARKNKLIYKAGFNHRFHPALSKAHEIFSKGKIGKLMYIKSTYGIGGRPGYEKEWRMNPEKSGGGELVDQGSHLIDLSIWFMGKITQVRAELATYFWPVKVEDNVFLWLKSGQKLAELHASWTEWKNRFIFEVYGTAGYLKINGLGGSYGVETLTWGTRVPGQAPLEKTWKFDGPDQSWEKEWKNFRRAVTGLEEVSTPGAHGLEMLRIVEKVYNARYNKYNVGRK